MGVDLYPSFIALMQFGDRWLAAGKPTPLTLVHTSCGYDSHPLVACSHCGERVGARDVTYRDGPGAGRHPAKAAGTRPVAVRHVTRADAFAAMGAGDQGVTVVAASLCAPASSGVGLPAGKPAVTELHQGDEARIEIDPHLGEAILLALRGAGCDLTEDCKLRQLLQAIRERSPRYAKRRTEGFEGPCVQKTLRG